MHPAEAEVPFIHRLYQKTFAFDDGGTIDPYFQHHFHPEHCWVVREGEQIVSLLCAHPHRMVFSSGFLPVRFISGVITITTKRRQGYMRRCFEALEKDTQDSCALYVLQAYHPEIYIPLGFTQRYFIRYLPYQGEPLPDHCTIITSSDELADCAQAALRRWEGWMDHDAAFYEAQLTEAAALKQPLLGFYRHGKLAAFARLSPSGNITAAEEILGRSERDCQQLLGQLKTRFPHLVYTVPQSAKMPHTQGNLMVKMGNAALCSERLKRTVTSCDDLYLPAQSYYHYGWW